MKTAGPAELLQIREWSIITPDTPKAGALLRGRRLDERDRELLASLSGRTSLQVTELREGLSISVGPHVGTLKLAGLRLVIRPKLDIAKLMQMVAYAFELSDMVLTHRDTSYLRQDHGIVDLLGLSLLREAQRIARGGIVPKYQPRIEDLATPRGRFDMRHIATHPRHATLRCAYEELSFDHELNQILAAGLRFSAGVMDSMELRLELARSAERFFGDMSKTRLSTQKLKAAQAGLDRRTSHYRNALMLIDLIHTGSRLGEHHEAGKMPLFSFMLNMNRVFERFLDRYFRENAPANIRVHSQDFRSGVFTYLENAGGWRQPTIRPDFVFRQQEHTIAVADAKYKNRVEHPPSSAELYQLTTYGLAYPMPSPRQVLLLHPLVGEERERPSTLLFAPAAASQQVCIRLVGVPVDRMLEESAGGAGKWWPLQPAAESVG